MAPSFSRGSLDEVYVAPVALTSPEVYDLAFVHEPATRAPLSGVVSEVPLLDDAVMALHLEEASGERFADSSEWANDAACSGATCPARVTTGTFGQALKFDGGG